MAEIRAYDVPYKSHEDLKSFIWKYAGHDKRFIDPQFHFSHPARLTFRSKAQIAQYLVNYIGRDTSYAELKRNCQTFCADLCSFVAGKKVGHRGCQIAASRDTCQTHFAGMALFE